VATEKPEVSIEKLNTHIMAALGGSVEDYRTVHKILLDKLVVLPLLGASAPWEGESILMVNPYSEVQSKLLLGADEEGKVAPVFTSRSACQEWLVGCGQKGEAIPMYLTDFSKVLWRKVRVVLNPGLDTAIMLDRCFIPDPGDVMRGVKEGLYPPFSVERDPDPGEPIKHVSLDKPDLKKEEKVSVPVVQPAMEQLAQGAGIDFRTPEFRAQMAAEPRRERQGTFSKILDALKAYRR